MIFTQEIIDKNKQYFNIPNVIKTANDIKEAAKSINKLNNYKELDASFVLAYLLLQEENNKRS